MSTTFRCAHCGNRTRFDVFETVTRRRYVHYTLGGEANVDEEEILESNIQKVVCRWCERSDGIETEEQPEAGS
jgi:hypothetical protein